MKYADPNAYEMGPGAIYSRRRAELMAHEQLAPSKAIVDLLDEEPLEVEIATTLLYEHCHLLTGRFARRYKSQESGGGGRSSISACGIVASTTKCCAHSGPGSSSGSTF